MRLRSYPKEVLLMRVMIAVFANKRGENDYALGKSAGRPYKRAGVVGATLTS